MNESITIDLAVKPESARLARQRLEPFHDLLGEERFGDLRLLVSGLVVEAIGALGERGDDTIALRVECDEELVRASVRAEAEASFVLSTSPDPSGLGWSGYLLQRLSDRRGVRRDETGTTAWLEMSLKESASAS